MTAWELSPDAEADANTASRVLREFYDLDVSAALIRVWGTRGEIEATRFDREIGRRGATLYRMRSVLERARHSAAGQRDNRVEAL